MPSIHFRQVNEPYPVAGAFWHVEYFPEETALFPVGLRGIDKTNRTHPPFRSSSSFDPCYHRRMSPMNLPTLRPLLPKLTLLATACALASCVPKTPSPGAGFPSVNAEGRFADTLSNRAYSLDSYRTTIETELRHPEESENWEAFWRRTFGAIDENAENPAWVRSAIRTMRRDANLPVWKFMH